MDLKIIYTIAAVLMLTACTDGEGKREGTHDRPQSSVGTTFEQDTLTSPATTGTSPAGETTAVDVQSGANDQTGPTGSGKGKDGAHPEAPAY